MNLMHYCAELWLPDTDEVREDIREYQENGNGDGLEARIQPIMEPFCEQNTRGKRAFFDYWVIGGRWTGNHDNFNAWEAPENFEVCDMCHGTGKRMDGMQDVYRGCNGCSGTGLKVKWNLEPHAQDIMPVRNLRPDLTCYTLVVPLARLKLAKVFSKEVWDGSDFKSTEFGGTNIQEFLRTKVKVTDGFLVTLDYHC